MFEEKWFIDPTQAAGLSESEGGIIRDEKSAGNYNDMPGEEELQTIDFLTKNPWREGLSKRFSGKPWLRSIIIDERRPDAVLQVALKPHSRILDVGAGWGQLSIPLAKCAHQVCALDQTISRLRILDLIAKQEEVDLMRLCGDIETFPFRKNSFDLIILNGVLEWTIRDRHEATPDEHQISVLQRCVSLLADGGKIFLGIENAMGLKYIMGCRDDHAGIPWVNLNDDQQSEERWRTIGANRMLAKTQDLCGYRKLFLQSGLTEEMTWGCFPDYKLPQHVIPVNDIDEFLLGKDEWKEHHGNNGEPLPEEWPMRDVYRRFAQAGCGKLIAPSYAFSLIRKPQVKHE